MSGNWKYNHKLAITSPSIFHPIYLDTTKHSMALINFQKGIGEEWEKNLWFYSAEKPYPYNSKIKTSRFNRDSLISLKSEIKSTQKNLIEYSPTQEKSELIAQNKILISKINSYTQSYKEEKPFSYYFISPFKYLIRLVSASSTYRMFGSYQTTSKKLLPFRLIIDFVFWAFELLLIIALFIVLRNWRENLKVLLIGGIIVYFYSFHTLIFKSNDFRYIIPVIPFIVLLSLSVTNLFIGNAKTMKTKV